MYKHLQQFLLEPFFEHEEKEERYLAIYTELEHDVILFHNEGGVNIGDIDEKVNIAHFFTFVSCWVLRDVFSISVSTILLGTECPL